MKMVPILLFVLTVMPVQLLSSDHYEYDDHDNQPTFIPAVMIDLQPTSIAYIKKWAEITAGIGAVLGGCIVSSNLQGNHLSTFEKIGLIIGGSAISGFLCSLTGALYSMMQTDEKRYEQDINRVIQLYNDAYHVYSEIDLVQNQRQTLSLLLAQDFHEAHNRVAVYQYVYPLSQKNNLFSAQCPIDSVVDYLDGLANALERELYAIHKIIPHIPSNDDILLSSAKEEEIANVIKTIVTNQQMLVQLNTILSPQLIRQWADQMRNMPEYNIQELRAELAKEYTANPF